MSLDAWQLTAAGAVALGAGAINAIAGGGTLVSFPTLVAIGVPAVSANVTNTVALCPGYLGGALAMRRELEGQARRARALGATAAVGGLAGSIAEGIERARESIASGSAKKKLETFVATTQKLGAIR